MLGNKWREKHGGLRVPFKGTPEQHIELGLRHLSEQWQRCGYNFVPLITADACRRCSLDILFLRPEEGQNILQGGDIDGRIKTIFDALRLPSSLREVASQSPTEGEDPFFVLLEDDSLISEIRVVTDQLLLLPKEREVRPNDAHLVIHVSFEPKTYERFFW